MQMAHTPLHVSAGHNSVEIVKVLLDWQGSEKVELEAKNMVCVKLFEFLASCYLADMYLPLLVLNKLSQIFLNFVWFLNIMFFCSMEKLLFIWLLRMGAIRLHKCFFVMVLLLKPKQMYAFLLPY